MHFVLVHGAWHGAWCWERLVPALEAAGAGVTTLDLPGHGEDDTPLDAVTLDAYADRVEHTVRELDRPVELVGHSMGGAVVSAVAERLPRHVTGLSYLCAFLLRDGESLAAVGATDPDAELNDAVVRDADSGGLIVPREAARRIFYGDCPADAARAALDRLRPQAVAPLRTPLELTDAAFGRVPRAYLLCTEDRAVSPALQRRMIDALPCDPVVELPTGHSPFLADPRRLADDLVGIAHARD
jgi:pimeloyl-ACP methyl ester carboxylesterase